MVKNLLANAGDVRDTGSIPGLGRSSGGGHGSPLQCSCLKNSMDRGAWRATVHGVAKSWTRLSNEHTLHDGMEPASESLCPELTPETTGNIKATQGVAREEGREQGVGEIPGP